MTREPRAQDLLSCVLCKRDLIRHNHDVFFTPGCNHAFCDDCKDEYLNCAKPFFLDSSIKQLDVNRELKTKAKVCVYFRCPVCGWIFDQQKCDATHADEAVPQFKSTTDKLLYDHIFHKYIATKCVNDSEMLKLVCTNHKSANQMMTCYCVNCSLPLCRECGLHHDQQHRIESLDRTRQDYVENLSSAHQYVKQSIHEFTQQRASLLHLRAEQECLARKEQQEIESHMRLLIDYVKKVGDSLIFKLKNHLKEKADFYQQAITFCDYSIRSASKLDQFYRDLGTTTSQSRDAELILNYPAISDRTHSLEMYRMATKSTVVYMQKALHFRNGAGQPHNNHVTIGCLEPTDIPLPKAEISPMPKAPVTRRHDAHLPPPKSRTPSKKAPESTDIIPSTHLLKQHPTLLWENVVSHGFDPKDPNPCLAGAHYLDDDRLLVAENNKILLFDREGKTFSRFNAPRLLENRRGQYEERLWPQCITKFDEDHVAFTDRHQMTVYIYRNDGEFAHRMNQEIFRKTPFKRTDTAKFEASAVFGLAVLDTGHLAVSDAIQRSIYIVDPSTETILHRFGDGGSDDSRLRKPTFLAVDKRGRILVSDSESNYIKLYDVNGGYIGQCNACAGAMPYAGQNHFSGLQAPGAIVVDPVSGDIIVANNDPNHGLLHLSRVGEYLHTLTVKEGQRKRTGIPFGLALGSRGQLALTNKHAGSVSVVQLYE